MISLIIPTLNEREALPILLAELQATLADWPRSLEVILVDDGSQDGTVVYAESVKASVPFSLKIIQREERGLATAVVRGIHESEGDILGVMDADLSHPPAHIPLLVQAIDAGSDIAIGSRHVEGGRVEEWPWHRVLVSSLATLAAQLLVPGIRDPLSGFFVCKREVIAGKNLAPLGYKILLEILAKGSYEQVTEIPYTFRNREVGKSKLNGRVMQEYVRHLGRLGWYKIKSKIH